MNRLMKVDFPGAHRPHHADVDVAPRSEARYPRRLCGLPLELPPSAWGGPVISVVTIVGTQRSREALNRLFPPFFSGYTGVFFHLRAVYPACSTPCPTVFSDRAGLELTFFDFTLYLMANDYCKEAPTYAQSCRPGPARPEGPGPDVQKGPPSPRSRSGPSTPGGGRPTTCPPASCTCWTTPCSGSP